MQLFQQPFDANQVKPQEAFEPVPEGWYILAIRNSEGKPTRDNESGYLSLELEVIDGEHKGRKLFDNLNLWNKSQQAAEIAQRQLSAYCRATGVMILTDSTQLHGIPLKAKVGIKKDEGYEARNVIKAVKHVQDATPAPGNPALAHVPPAPSVPAVPFGQNPALPPQPAPAAFAPQMPSQPMQQPQPTTQQPPWGAPAQPAAPMMPPQAQQPMPQQPQGFPAAAPWAPSAQQPQQPVPAVGGPVPPWRR